MKQSNGNRTSMVGLAAIVGILAGGAAAVRAEIIMSEPSNLGPLINHAGGAQACDFSHDGLELYFAAYNRSGGFGGGDIWVSTRETLDSPWQEPVNLGPNVNSSGSQVEPSISSDGLELYFGCWDDWILRVCTRPSKDAPWSKPEKIGPPVGSIQPAMELGSDDAWRPDISSDGLSLYFSSTRAGGYGGTDIWMATRATTADPWTAPVNLGPNVNTGGDDVFPNISTDGLTVVFNRGFASIYASTRRSIDDDWGPAVQLGIRVPSPGNFHSAALSPDGSTLYFEAVAAWGGYGSNDFWQVEFIPVVDFNADGIADLADLVRLIGSWGKEGAAYDISPLPLGDGIVNQADLEVLMGYWGQEVDDPTLVGHWALDETEGFIASDGVGYNDGTILGSPQWRPQDGRIDGALEFNGTTFVTAKSALSPAAGAFSVLAWTKGGSPGETVISQAGDANWLATDGTSGALTTELSKGGRTGSGLSSQTIITDDTWHRIAFTWDNVHRRLYVDGVLVAEDAQDSLAASAGNVIIGAAKNMAPGTFWTGLIDDVRVYNRAVRP